MARSTFEGPILSGDNRFGALRDVGYTVLEQDCYIDLSNSTAGTAGYSGGSGQFAWGNNIPNLPGTVYTPSSVYSANGPTVQTIPADTTTQVYRGVVMYIPNGSEIIDATVDYISAITGESGATLSNVSVFVSNNYTAAAGTPAYATAALGTTTVGTAGRQSITYTGTNLANLLATTADIQNPTLGANPSFLSQVVFTLSITGTSVAAPTGGKLNFILRYSQPDNNIGTLTQYPYGNLD